MLREKITDQNLELYANCVDGKLKRETYARIIAALQQRLEGIFEKTESIEQHIFKAKSEQNRFVDSYVKYAELEELTSKRATRLLGRATIWPEGRRNLSLMNLYKYPDIQ